MALRRSIRSRWKVAAARARMPATVQLACSTGNTAQWSLVSSTLRNRASGACLDVPNNATAQDTPLLTWTCNGGNNQNWVQLP